MNNIYIYGQLLNIHQYIDIFYKFMDHFNVVILGASLIWPVYTKMT